MSGSAQLIFSWDEAFQAGVEKVGGKGFSLARLERYGFQIPPGVVLSTDAYQLFIEHNGLSRIIDELSPSLTLSSLDEYSWQLTQLQERILAGTFPAILTAEILSALEPLGLETALAVRSSASAEDAVQHSFAGIHATTLNVLGSDQVFQAIKTCYASLWTPQAVTYRRRFYLSDQEVLPAVVIMEMVKAEAAGVAFSCDPLTGRRDLLVVQANFGLGESVVQGAIEPDAYYLDSSAWHVLPRLVHKQIGRKAGFTSVKSGGGTSFVSSEEASSRQVLPDQAVESLGLLILRVFEALGEGEKQLDIEWAFDGQQFVLLQARPVTVLPRYTFAGFSGQKDVWSNGNYRDAVPMVLSPLQRRVAKEAIDTIQYTSLSAVEYPIPEGFQFSRLFQGRLYCNVSALQWAYYDCSGMLPRDFNPFWGGHQPELEIAEADPFQGEQGKLRQERGMQGFTLMMEAGASANQAFSEVHAAVKKLLPEDFAALADQALLETYNRLGEVLNEYSIKFNFLAGAGNFPMVMLLQKLSKYLGERTMLVANGLMVGGEAVITSADHGYRLMQLAQLAREDQAARLILESSDFNPLDWEQVLPDNSPFKSSFSRFIEEFGHRAVYELDIINPRWRENPSYLFDIIQSTLATANPDQWQAVQRAKYDEAWQELVTVVPTSELVTLKQDIKQAQEGAALREMTKSVLVLAVEGYRKLALELGKRFQQRSLLNQVEDIFFCSWQDVFAILTGAWDGKGLKTLLVDRRLLHTEQEMLAAPDLIMDEEPIYSRAELNPSGNYLQGVGAAAGKASGLARIINNPHEGTKLQPGEILVAPSTDPGWTPLFLKASALIMETGGLLSHGAIVAREFGVPAVVNVPGVMRIIVDGQAVAVDGGSGKIFLSLN